jgi:hypothetical protein
MGGLVTLSGVTFVLLSRERDAISSVDEERASVEMVVVISAIATERTFEAPKKSMFLIVGEPTKTHPSLEAGVMMPFRNRSGIDVAVFAGRDATAGKPGRRNRGGRCPTLDSLPAGGCGNLLGGSRKKFTVTVVPAALERRFQLLGKLLVGKSGKVPVRILVNTNFAVDVSEDVLVGPVKDSKRQLKFDLKG